MKKLKTPTFAELLAAYPQIAKLERIKSERPCVKTVGNVLTGVRRLLETLGDHAIDRPIDWLTEERIDTFLSTAIQNGFAPVSAWAYVMQLRGLTARWTRPYYRALGLNVTAFQLPM